MALFFYWGNKMNELEKFEQLKLFMRKVRARYAQQKCQADKRNVKWLFTFETWWKMWNDSGKWEQRGRKTGQYCMARKGDVGPYSVDNVDIVLVSVNTSDARKGKAPTNKGRKVSADTLEKMRINSTGVKQSIATRKKKSIANKGKPWSEARRAAHKGAWNKGLKTKAK